MRFRTTIAVLALVGWQGASYAATVEISPGDTAHCASGGWAPTPTTNTAQCVAAVVDDPEIEGVPICGDHDIMKWHGLVKYAANGSITCTYGHEHKDDPRAVDSTFGPLAYDEISYPWQTSSSLGLENKFKHNFYNWAVVKDLECKSGAGPLSLTNFRLEYHGDGNAGATVRFHSFYLQAEGCDKTDPSYHGTISVGGHMDYGSLFLRTSDDNILTYVPLPGDIGSYSGGQRRMHANIAGPARGDFTWYGSNQMAQIGIRKEDSGPIDPAEPSRLIFYGGEANGSGAEPGHVVSIGVPDWWDGEDGVLDGYITVNTFVDRGGHRVADCSPLGPDCVPLKVNHWKAGPYQYRGDEHGIIWRDYDVRSPVTGKSLIRWPN